MRTLLVSTESRLNISVTGAYLSPDAGRSYPFWRAYLDTFDAVRVLARVDPLVTTSDSPTVEGPGVSVLPLPDYRGPTQYLAARKKLQKILDSYIDSQTGETAYLSRLPGLIGTALCRQVRKRSIPYGVELVGDPYDVLLSGVVPSLVAPLPARMARSRLRKDCKQARVISYVTDTYLQGNYPAADGADTFSISDVQIPLAHLREPHKEPTHASPKLVTVGSLDQPYKGIATLLEAVRILHARGVLCRLEIVGDGRLAAGYRNLAADLGISRHIVFRGRLPNVQSVQQTLTDSDLFVLASYTEGMPRALIEAMASGLPCIATTVGGIPDLLPEHVLAGPRSALGLADKIEGLLGDPEIYRSEASRNRRRAEDFVSDVLEERRKKFRTALANR